MMFTGIDNPFGATAFEPTTTSQSTVYYKTMRLERKPTVRLAAPKPLSHHLKNFLLNF